MEVNLIQKKISKLGRKIKRQIHEGYHIWTQRRMIQYIKSIEVFNPENTVSIMTIPSEHI